MMIDLVGPVLPRSERKSLILHRTPLNRRIIHYTERFGHCLRIVIQLPGVPVRRMGTNKRKIVPTASGRK